MAYQALYRKYRPKTFSDVIGQEHITETLKSELNENKTVHAYLFTGTRGTGKTSCAKILANAVNCLNPIDGNPCLECAACKAIADGSVTDIVEIDAASNNSVDSIRQLRDLIPFAPASSKYRVFIIDEVHMLSISAFNALLKTLEEPPAHVIFILATTEVHKLPATILSRCQRFDFKRIDNLEICKRIQHVAQNEGLTVTDDAATLIASAADGGMRDALSILDLCAAGTKNIDEETVESVCSMAGNDYLLELSEAIKNQSVEDSLLLIDKLHNSSVDMVRLLSELTSHYRDLMIVKTVKTANRPIVCSAGRLKALETQAESYDIKDIMYCIGCLQAASAGMQIGNRRCEMEMAVIKMCNPSFSSDTTALERRISALENGNIKFKVINEASPNKPKPSANILDLDDGEIPPPAYENEAPAPIDENSDKPTEPMEKPDTKTADNGDSPIREWTEILSILKTSSPLIAGVLNGSNAYIKDDFLLIDAPNTQFRTMINSGNNSYKDSIRKAAQTVLGNTYKLGPYSKASKAQISDPLKDIAEKLKKFETN